MPERSREEWRARLRRVTGLGGAAGAFAAVLLNLVTFGERGTDAADRVGVSVAFAFYGAALAVLVWQRSTAAAMRTWGTGLVVLAMGVMVMLVAVGTITGCMLVDDMCTG